MQNTRAYTHLKSPVTGLVGWILSRHFFPLSTGAEHPQNTVQYLPITAPGSSSTIGSTRKNGEQWFNELPLMAGEIHKSSLTNKNSQAFRFMRLVLVTISQPRPNTLLLSLPFMRRIIAIFSQTVMEHAVSSARRQLPTILLQALVVHLLLCSFRICKHTEINPAPKKRPADRGPFE
jgi:hypothetical protein